MELRVESLEANVLAMRGMEEMKSQMGEMNSGMGNMGLDMETIKDYLRDLRESIVGRDGGDKGTTPIYHERSPSHSPLARETSAPPGGGNEEWS